MDQHLGASITLSFALVVMFAIILYEPDPAPLPTQVREVSDATKREPGPSTPAPLPSMTPPDEPLAEWPAGPGPVSEPAAPPAPEALRRREPERLVRTSAGGMKSLTTARRAGSGAAIAAPATGVSSTRHHGERVPAHDAFTLANAGETLRDVAERVYGSPAESDALWRLNRDLVGGRDAPLAAGTLLRTP